jgi:hypothetical protein
MKAVYYNYYLLITIKVNCREGGYSYKIYNTWFRPKSGFVDKVIRHPTSPDYLIDFYKKKKYSVWTIDGPTIRSYLSAINEAIINCTASLNKAMIN